jgi:PAS domain S-box-containing protein
MNNSTKTTEYFELLDADETQNALLAAIVNASDDTIVSKTLNGIITSWNAAAERMFGYSRDEAIGRHISLIIPPSRMLEEDYIISQILAGQKVEHLETIRLAKDGREIPISLSVSSIRDSQGIVIGASKIARDISAQREAETVAERFYEQLRELDRQKDTFIGLASHELRTPLTSISGYLQILNRVNKDDSCQKYIDKALLQVKKMSDLVNGLLEFSRIETGRMRLSKTEFELQELIDESVVSVFPMQGKHKIILERTANECVVYADRERIGQVLTGLLVNAIKYSPDRHEITLLLRPGKKTIKVGVKDEGVGIAAANLDQIFTRFYRSDETAPHISGLGIGLYLAREIINRHQGKLWAESEPGKGSTFWLSLPR